VTFALLFLTFLGTFTKLREASIRSVMSVCQFVRPHGTTRLPLDGFSWNFSKICQEDLSFIKILTRITGTLSDDVCTFMKISQRFFLSMRNFSDKFAEKIKTHIFCSMMFLQQLFHLWDNVETYGTTGKATSYNTIRHMNIACWMTRARYTRSWCVILPAFPL